MKRRAFKLKSSTKLVDMAERNSEYEEAAERAKERFKLDQLIFQEIGLCSFIRPCVEGEIDGFNLPNNIDASSIKYVYVLHPGSMEHVRKHMNPLPSHLGAVMFDMLHGERVHARILLTEDQMEIVKASMNKAETGLYLNGKAVK